jgi:hypothetical protein
MKGGEKVMVKVVLMQKLKHKFNPLHVYCRMREVKVPKSVSIFICKKYEVVIFNHIFMHRSNKYQRITYIEKR